MIDLKIALLSEPADLLMSEQHLMSLMKKVQCLEDDVSAIMEEANQHQMVHDWFSVSAEPCKDELPVDGQLSDLRMVIQDLLKSAKSKVKLQPFYTASLWCQGPEQDLIIVFFV